MTRRAALLFSVALLIPLIALPQEKKEKIEKLAPYYPTPEAIVEKMLELGGLKPGETMFDLGSGDGRIVIIGAKKFKANAIGVEYDESLYHQSTDRIAKLGLTKTARIIHGDIFDQDYSKADVLAVYLLPVSNDKVAKLLDKQLKPGTRIVAHDFEFSAWKPVKIVDIDDDGEGRSHRLYLYVK
jgi:protein-L-isoaspartate O-methyltransferase